MRVCVEWWTALSAYADDALAPDERERVEAHLEQCASCRAASVQLQVLRQGISLLPQYEPPPMLKARILSATVDQPTWSERLAANWRRWAWRASWAAAAVVLGVLGWQVLSRQMPRVISTFVADVGEKRAVSRPQVASAPKLRDIPKVVAEQPAASKVAKRAPVRSSVAVAKRSAPKKELRWSVVARTPIAPEPAPADALQGEPVIPDDVPYIDVNSPPAGEQVATEPEEAESKTVATRFAIPAEVLNQGTSGLEALRQQVRIQNREQLSGEMKRKLQRKQVDVDVITVRF